MRLAELRHSGPVRLGTAYALLIAVSLGIHLAVLLAFVNHDTREQTREAIQQDVRALADLYRTQGRQELVDDLRILSKSTEGDRSLYLLEEAGGTVIAGNGKSLAPFQGWTEIQLPRTSKRPDRFLIYAQPLDDLILLVGRRTHAEREVGQAVLRSFGLAILLVVPLSVAAAFYLGKRAFRRVDEIATAIRAFVNGALTLRVPVAGRGDEFDRLAGTINVALQRIETLLNNLRQVTTDIAHDLRTPLGRLRQRLENAGSSPEPDPNLVPSAIEEIDGILATFDSLLHIAEIDAGVARARFGDLDLAGLAREVGDIYGSVAEDHGHKLTVEAANPAMIRGDRGLLTQLLANVIENAIRHTPEGTTIRLAVSAAAGTSELVVADNGPGIPESERARVFARFFRMEQSRSTPGSGLGLTLVKSICELHGGAIALRDAAPGLMVAIRFPAAGLALSGPVPPQPPS